MKKSQSPGLGRLRGAQLRLRAEQRRLEPVNLTRVHGARVRACSVHVQAAERGEVGRELASARVRP